MEPKRGRGQDTRRRSDGLLISRSQTSDANDRYRRRSSDPGIARRVAPVGQLPRAKPFIPPKPPGLVGQLPRAKPIIPPKPSGLEHRPWSGGQDTRRRSDSLRETSLYEKGKNRRRNSDTGQYRIGQSVAPVDQLPRAKPIIPPKPRGLGYGVRPPFSQTQSSSVVTPTEDEQSATGPLNQKPQRHRFRHTATPRLRGTFSRWESGAPDFDRMQQNRGITGSPSTYQKELQQQHQDDTGTGEAETPVQSQRFKLVATPGLEEIFQDWDSGAPDFEGMRQPFEDTKLKKKKKGLARTLSRPFRSIRNKLKKSSSKRNNAPKELVNKANHLVIPKQHRKALLDMGFDVQSEEPIGQSNAGCVYLGECNSDSGELAGLSCAIKMSKHTKGDKSEPQVNTILSHPNIVCVYLNIRGNEEIPGTRIKPRGNEPSAQYVSYRYMAVEYCNGGTLRDRLKPEAPAITADEAISMIRQLTAGLTYLHNNNVVHNDLHSGKILLHQESGPTIYKIADFGKPRGSRENTSDDIQHLSMHFQAILDKSDVDPELRTKLKPIIDRMAEGRYRSMHHVQKELLDIIGEGDDLVALSEQE